MAEDMLRPMLQDWLDNNLPTLVERLVREEIERVARGAQSVRLKYSLKSMRRLRAAHFVGTSSNGRLAEDHRG
jgi:hypothetical protein